MRVVKRESLGSTALQQHGCLEYKCKYCKESFRVDAEVPHLCQVQPPTERELGGASPGQPQPSFFRVFFDLETVRRSSDNQLVPYLLCAVFVCSKCVADVEDPSHWRPVYECCGKRKRIYWFEEGLRSFLSDVYGGRKDMKRGILAAYNARNFDG